MGKHKMKSVTCVLTCMEETCIEPDVKYEIYTHENIQYRGIIKISEMSIHIICYYRNYIFEVFT